MVYVSPEQVVASMLVFAVRLVLATGAWVVVTIFAANVSPHHDSGDEYESSCSHKYFLSQFAYSTGKRYKISTTID